MGLQVRDHAEATTATTTPWRTLLVAAVVVVAAADVVQLALIGEIIPPLAAGVVLTAVGVGLLRARPRAGVAVLGVASLALLVASAPFALPHLAHPESGVDFVHAVIGTAGRLVAVAAAAAIWRHASDTTARRLTTVAAGLLAVAVATAGVASLATTGDVAGQGDVRAEIRDGQFPDEVRVASGGTTFVDNRDLFRHTFTVVGTDVDVELPAKTGVRVPVDLAPGVYELICAIPGHEAMTATLHVQ